ncbi:MAG: hypothetical protein KA712_21765 [Myxococcales bacterium]|nr:hypothetical protein [Myxococcales bacterium]
MPRRVRTVFRGLDGALCVLLGLVSAASGLAACGGSNMGLQELKGGIELGVRRGAAWTTLTVKPPYVIGPRTNLKLERGVFSGNIDGRGVKLYVDESGVHGQGPFGNVNVEIFDGPDSMTIEGTWNDSRVHFKVTEDSFRGTIPVWNNNAGLLRDVESCQYVLDKVDVDGSRMGFSTCNNLPEDTRIEVPAAVQDWLTRPELTAILLALLSSPPTTYLERSF